MKSKDERYPDYPLFKGMQRPLEFLGIQGRYIYWAAVTTCGAIIGFVDVYKRQFMGCAIALLHAV